MQLRELARKRQTKAKRCAACWRPAALIEHVEDLTASIRSELQVQQLRRSAIGDSISTAALIPFFEIEPFQAER